MKQFVLTLFRNSFIQNSLVLFLGTMVVNVLNYVFHLAVGRLVDPVMYGEIESLIAFLTIAVVPAGTLTLIATKYGAFYKASQNFGGLERLSLYLNKRVFIIGLPLLGGCFLLTPAVARFLNFSEPMPIYLLWIAMLFSFLSAVTLGLLTGWQAFGSVNKVNIVATCLKLVAAVALLKLGFELNGVITSLVLAGVLGYIVSVVLLRKLFSTHQGVEFQKSFSSESIRSFILPAFYATLAIAIFGNIDIVFAKHHLEGVASGEYGALSIASKTIFFVTSVLTTVLFTMSAEKDSKQESSLKTLGLAASLIMTACVVAVIIFGVFPEFVLQLFFGATYVGVSSKLIWFAVAASLYSLNVLLLQYLMSIHVTRAATIFLALSSLEVVVLLFAGSSLYSIIGVSIATQIIGIILGGWYIFSQRKSHEQAPIYSHSGL